MSFRISLRDTSFYISLNSLEFYLSLECLEFSLTCIFHHVWENLFDLCFSNSLKVHCIESMHFYSWPSSPLKTPGRMFRKSVSLKTNRVEKTMICFIKIKSEMKIKMTWNIRLLYFVCFINFLNVMDLQFYK